MICTLSSNKTFKRLRRYPKDSSCRHKKVIVIQIRTSINTVFLACRLSTASEPSTTAYTDHRLCVWWQQHRKCRLSGPLQKRGPPRTTTTVMRAMPTGS